MTELLTPPLGKRTEPDIAFDHLKPAAPPTGKPELTWIAPGEPLVDAASQPDLSDASRKFNCVRRYHTCDGRVCGNGQALSCADCVNAEEVAS